MPTSGTAVSTLDIADIIEEAWEVAGAEARNGYDIRTARRSLMLLALDWANRGYNLWTVEEGAVPLFSGVATYALPLDTIDLIQMVIRQTTGTSQMDIAVSRIGMSTYATIPVKNTQGRPVQVWVDRQIEPQFTVWPVPNDNTYTLIYWRMRRIQDVGTTGELTYDIPQRFLPCLTAGLAYKLAMKRPELAERLPMLEAEYEKLWRNAAAEDRERVAFRIVPQRQNL
jgi:hypothetical protein